MISVQQAEKIVLSNLPKFSPVEVSLEKSFGMILAENIKADRDLPPIDRATMDGIAINFSSWKKGQKKFLIEGIQAAGTNPLKLSSVEHAIEIMTGAVVSIGCDCVIPYEDIQIDATIASLNQGLIVSRLQNIHRQASDHRKGEVVLRRGSRIRSPQVAIAASVGKSRIKAYPKISVAIISTGDELVEIGAKSIQSYQVRKSNALAVSAALKRTALFETRLFHVKDDQEQLRQKLNLILKKFDVLILSGGISKGKFDYVPAALKDLGVNVLFHRVTQRPGKPFWFGKSKTNKLVFALPGNPVSTLVCAHRYVIPSLKVALGLQVSQKSYAVLNKSINSKSRLTNFLPAKLLSGRDGRLNAEPVSISGSGDFVSLTTSDGFLELNPPSSRWKKGYVGQFFAWS